MRWDQVSLSQSVSTKESRDILVHLASQEGRKDSVAGIAEAVGLTAEQVADLCTIEPMYPDCVSPSSALSAYHVASDHGHSIEGIPYKEASVYMGRDLID